MTSLSAKGPLRIFLLERAPGMIQTNAEELVGSEARPISVALRFDHDLAMAVGLQQPRKCLWHFVQ